MTSLAKLKYRGRLAYLTALLIAFQAGAPVHLGALTSGPSQPEFNAFEPIGTTQMVDLFSGDFTYNIPLFELPGPDGGYPFNLAYHSGITMDQEASWVGLGWTLNHGAITRTMRGLPDDFDGDEVTRRMDMKENRTWQVGVNGHAELMAYKLDRVLDNVSLGLGLGMKVMHNSYRGWGLSLSFSPNAGITNSQGEGIFGVGVSLSASSFDGAGIQPSISFGDSKRRMGRITLSSSINSREGVQSLSLGYSRSYTSEKDVTKKNKKTGENITGKESYTNSVVGGTSSYSFGKSAHSPSVAMAYRGMNFTGTLEVGGYVGTFLGVGGGVNVSFMRQRLKNKGIWVGADAYGYFNAKNYDGNDNSLQDMNREKDGPIYEDSPNLAAPISTPDIYSVMGHGTGGMYRAYRSNVGIYSNPFQKSSSGGGRLGVEVNLGPGFDLGVDFGGNYAVSTSKNWNANSSLGPFQFDEVVDDAPEYETYYFKAAGELTAEPIDQYDYIGHDKAVRLARDDSNTNGDYDQSGVLEYSDGSSFNITEGARASRKPRANSIGPITNQELIGLGTEEALNEYKIKYYSTISSFNDYSQPPDETLVRDGARSHIAGITSLQPNGMRYVYGLPVKNNSQEELTFSVPPSNICNPVHTSYGSIDANTPDYDVSNTDKYLNHTKVPEYTHSYLLTSVLGADYVDLDNEPGPSAGDHGYWVKFNYIKTSSNYGWRSPYYGANYMPGHASDNSDDKASIVYGGREQYYLATAETKTHIAEFELEVREDARGSGSILQQTAGVSFEPRNRSYRLKKISLYSKLERINPDGTQNENALPIKNVHFTTDYLLCPGVKNNINQTGKLTLEEVYFTYENSSRGVLSPYRFDYFEDEPEFNPGYNDLHYDRWGTHRVPSSLSCETLNFPYSDQYSDPEIINQNAAAWHLQKIHLPSGATIQVDYESDDYAYVQDRIAMQMFRIAGVGEVGTSSFNTNSKSGQNNHPQNELSTTDLKVYFELENGIDDIDKYVEELHGVKKTPTGLEFSESQLFYKIFVGLNNPSEKEYVSGYAVVKDAYIENVAGTDMGVIELEPGKVKNGGQDKEFHPMPLAAWQYLKMEFPSKIVPGASLDGDESTFEDAVNDLASAFGEFKTIFKKYYSKCSSEEFGKEIDLDRSFIRLNTPDRIKYGGGSRVQQVTLIDNWDVNGINGPSDDANTYGQVYDYTTLDNDGNIISSGVAPNEPAVGYEECALRYAKKWAVKSFLKTDQNMFFEYPINESYYPGSSVGYSKVTVKSLATHLAPTNNPTLPSGYSTTGITVNEFYTAKDFPVLVEETPLDKSIDVPRMLPLLVFNATYDKYIGTQGYAITLNDMHGKPSAITHYGMDDSGTLIDQELSKVVYTYSTSNKKVYTAAGNHKVASVVNNMVDVLVNESQDYEDAQIEPQQLGVDYDFFVDMRESTSFSGEMYLGINVDFTIPWLFGLGGVPNISINESRTRTAVTNKIIRRSGILIRTDAYDGQSHITTSNKVFDPINGEPLLTTVNNSFDDQIYNYNIPARYAYDRMGAAYENWGMKFKGILTADEDCRLFTMLINTPGAQGLLYPGDECIVVGFNNAMGCDIYEELCENRKFIYVGEKNGLHLFENLELTDEYYSADVEMMITRSGNRNHLTAKVGSITALKDPTINRSSFTENLNISIPNDLTTPGQSSITVIARSIDSVLNASAVTYHHAWDLERKPERDNIIIPSGGGGSFIGTDVDKTRPYYHIGERGIWRPYRNYVYSVNRLPDTDIDPHLATDGIYNDFMLFNWENPFFPKSFSAVNWRQTNQITKYAGNGEEVENRDILGLYSSALYGYADNLPIAVGANASHLEIAFESFEEYPLGYISGSDESGNFDFECFGGQKSTSLTYNILGGFIYAGGPEYEEVWIDKDYYDNIPLPSKALIVVQDVDGNEYEMTADVSQIVEVLPNNINVDIPFRDGVCALQLANIEECDFPTGMPLEGRVVLLWDFDYTFIDGCLNVADFGHTGDKSLAVSNFFPFEQKTLQLRTGKNYIFSAWVSRGPNASPKYTLDYGNLKVKLVFNGTETTFVPSGEVINGWQKVEGVFTPTSSDFTMRLEAGNLAYFDDIRIYPQDGNIQTYVYYPENYRLRAILDNNNYATFYHYDEEGNLFLIKKETARGIKTIQETRSFIKDTSMP